MLLKKYDSCFGAIRIRQDRDGDLSYHQNGCFHSQANRHGISLCAYIHAIASMIRQTKARHVLIIGCGGGTLATLLRRQHCHVTIVDINPLSFLIARHIFRMPGEVNCVSRDGIAYLRTARGTYDAVILDVFGSDNIVPAFFTTPRFFRLAKRRLSADGILIMNTIARDDQDRRPDLIAANMHKAHISVSLYDWWGERTRNCLIVGNARYTLHVPLGCEPVWMKDALRGLKRRGIKMNPPVKGLWPRKSH